jgi:hypothetical protein
MDFQAKGNSGPHIFSGLPSIQFTIFVLDSPEPTNSFPDLWTSILTKLSSSSLLETFKHQDAVVSAVDNVSIAALSTMAHLVEVEMIEVQDCSCSEATIELLLG